ADHSRPLLHGSKAPMISWLLELLLETKASAVIRDVKTNCVFAVVQFYRYLLWLTVPDGVADGLLPDAQQLLLDLWVPPGVSAFPRDFDTHRLADADTLNESFEGFAEIRHVRRSQIPD